MCVCVEVREGGRHSSAGSISGIIDEISDADFRSKIGFISGVSDLRSLQIWVTYLYSLLTSYLLKKAELDSVKVIIITSNSSRAQVSLMKFESTPCCTCIIFVFSTHSPVTICRARDPKQKLTLVYMTYRYLEPLQECSR